MKPISIGCVQLPYRALDQPPGLPRIRDNLAHLDGFYATREPVDLLLLGEFWLASPNGAADYPTAAVTVEELAGPLGEFARGRSLHVLANIVERGEDGRLYDSSVLLDPAGRVALHYRELAAGILAGSALVSPLGPAGEGGGIAGHVPVVDTELGRLGAVVGSDLAYPELFTAMTNAGVQVVLHSAKESRWAAGPWQQLKAARCIEGGFFLATANIADSSAALGEWGESCGASRVTDPLGAVLATSPTDGPDYVVAQVDPEQAAAAKQTPRLRRRVSAEWKAQCASIYLDRAAVTGVGEEAGWRG